MLAELPGWMDAGFLKGASAGAVFAACALAIVTVVWVRSLGTRLVVVALLAALAFAGVHYRGELDDCAKTCDCSFLGEEVEVDECGFSAVRGTRR